RSWGPSTNGFLRWSLAVIRKGALVTVLLVLFGLGAFFFGNRLPSSFMPDEDQATSTSACNFPARRRCNAPARLGDRWKTFSQTFREFNTRHLLSASICSVSPTPATTVSSSLR